MSIHKNQNNPWDRRAYSLIAKTQLIGLASNAVFIDISLVGIIFRPWRTVIINFSLYFKSNIWQKRIQNKVQKLVTMY